MNYRGNITPVVSSGGAARLSGVRWEVRRRMGSLQLQILKILWEGGPAAVADVHRALPGDLAYTTVATMLRKMEARELVRHREDGRRFVYEAAVREADVTASLAGDVLDRAFEGRLADMVEHLLTTRDVSADELDELSRLIAARRRRPS
jgi:BlaI family transcriptional regulator, penicillinase repressor